MKFPNLAWAIRQDGLANYHVAAAIELSETKFSRCLTGRSEFSPEDREKLAAFLRYPSAWLFLEISPPKRLLTSGKLTGLPKDSALIEGGVGI
jgi:hypothetical protein